MIDARALTPLERKVLRAALVFELGRQYALRDVARTLEDADEAGAAIECADDLLAAIAFQ